MSDISMCDNQNCDFNRSCYRFMAKPNPYRQAYTDFAPDEKTGECEYFMEIRGKKGPSPVDAFKGPLEPR
jgi:hypothetical protein